VKAVREEEVKQRTYEAVKKNKKKWKKTLGRFEIVQK